MSRPKVSVLVLVYNVSDYIEKCTLSLLNQTFQEVEYVFIDDFSTDNSLDVLMKVIDKYPHQKKNIKIKVHKNNKGIAFSRNEAINFSQGEYILFVDGDDYIEKNMIEKLYKEAIKDKADIVVCDFIEERNDKALKMTDKVYSSMDENFVNMIINESSHAYLWNKLIKRSLFKINECRIPDQLNYWEDLFLMTKFYYFTNKISKVNLFLYHYNQKNPYSITKEKNRMHFENSLQYWKCIDDFLENHKELIKHKELVQQLKLKTKVNLMFNTQSAHLRIEYADMFSYEEKKYFNQLKITQKIMLFSTRRKWKNFTRLLRTLTLIKKRVIR
ncbi:glycosyltransferase family 2 protein [Apibacter sp. HY039]|uniref:glycosyltransferase family 2 protein n=1 Tax=Apibacter sp. HY039 TaxID=2501476 RepID=UPI000FEB848F|nr:glycosyltransferase family 2 protein [Apibacter sp. HY039]